MGDNRLQPFLRWPPDYQQNLGMRGRLVRSFEHGFPNTPRFDQQQPGLPGSNIYINGFNQRPPYTTTYTYTNSQTEFVQPRRLREYNINMHDQNHHMIISTFQGRNPNTTVFEPRPNNNDRSSSAFGFSGRFNQYRR
jgi:hypothetical protein